MHRLPTLLQRLSAAQTRNASESLDAAVQTFRDVCFEPQMPCALPLTDSICSVLTGAKDLPARGRWFSQRDEDLRSKSAVLMLNTLYLRRRGDFPVPLELTRRAADSTTSFASFMAPFSAFLASVDGAQDSGSGAAASARAQDLYLAQCSISSLPQALQDDLPTPPLVLKAGKGDVYDSNIWMGMPPTFTPLHKDPNPNLFLQLSGVKVVRMFAPQLGTELFRHAQDLVGSSGSVSIRGEEMMQGAERHVLRELVWNDEIRPKAKVADVEFEVTVDSGDAVFVPKGWWHSIRGTGHGISTSVNWWFR